MNLDFGFMYTVIVSLLTRRPSERATGDEVEVSVKDALSGASARVEDGAITLDSVSTDNLIDEREEGGEGCGVTL